MRIFLLGSTGFLGSNIYKKLSKKFSVTTISLRNIPDLKQKKFLNKFNKSDVIINCAASLYPKNKNDFFINENFPKILYDHLNKNNKKCNFIHISTVNVLIKDRKDKYTNSKRESEKKLLHTKTTIIRLPLLVDERIRKIQNKGNLSLFYKYLNITFLPFYPMISPGHLYQPVSIHNLTNFISKIILKKNISRKIYNISGKKKKTLWDLFEEIAICKNKNFLKINVSILNIFLPKFIKEFLKKNNSFLQQLIFIDNTKYNNKFFL